MIFTAAISTFLLLAFANGHISQNGLQIRNRHNFRQLTHIFGHENHGILRIWFGFERMCSEYDVLRLAGAEVPYNLAVESLRSTSRGRYDTYAVMNEITYVRLYVTIRVRNAYLYS